MQYVPNRKKSPRATPTHRFAILGTLTCAAILITATPASAQIGYGYGTYTFYGSNSCGGSIGWGPPAPTVPSLGGYFPTYTFVQINGQWLYVPALSSDPSCFTSTPTSGGQTPPPSGPSELLIQSGDGGGGGAGDGGTNGDTPNDPPIWPAGPNYQETPVNTLTVTPEPSTVLLLGSGLVGLGIAVRRRRAKLTDRPDKTDQVR